MVTGRYCNVCNDGQAISWENLPTSTDFLQRFQTMQFKNNRTLDGNTIEPLMEKGAPATDPRANLIPWLLKEQYHWVQQH